MRDPFTLVPSPCRSGAPLFQSLLLCCRQLPCSNSYHKAAERRTLPWSSRKAVTITGALKYVRFFHAVRGIHFVEVISLRDRFLGWAFESGVHICDVWGRMNGKPFRWKLSVVIVCRHHRNVRYASMTEYYTSIKCSKTRVMTHPRYPPRVQNHHCRSTLGLAVPQPNK